MMQFMKGFEHPKALSLEAVIDPCLCVGVRNAVQHIQGNLGAHGANLC